MFYNIYRYRPIVHRKAIKALICVQVRCSWSWCISLVNTLRPRQNGRHFPDDILKWVFLNENVWISIAISLKFVPKGQINNIPALVQIMAWRRPGDKLLSEPMMVSLLTHICATRPQWVNGRRRHPRTHFITHNSLYQYRNYVMDKLVASRTTAGCTYATVP